MLPDERSSDDWYEEDCETAWVFRRCRDMHAFPAHKLNPYKDAMISLSGGAFPRIAINRKAEGAATACTGSGNILLPCSPRNGRH